MKEVILQNAAQVPNDGDHLMLVRLRHLYSVFREILQAEQSFLNLQWTV